MLHACFDIFNHWIKLSMYLDAWSPLGCLEKLSDAILNECHVKIGYASCDWRLYSPKVNIMLLGIIWFNKRIFTKINESLMFIFNPNVMDKLHVVVYVLAWMSQVKYTQGKSNLQSMCVFNYLSNWNSYVGVLLVKVEL